MGFNPFKRQGPEIIAAGIANTNEKSRAPQPPQADAQKLDDIQIAFTELQKRFIITKEMFNEQNTPEVVLANLLFANLVELNKLNRELALSRQSKE
jgi:hypothetical protein